MAGQVEGSIPPRRCRQHGARRRSGTRRADGPGAVGRPASGRGRDGRPNRARRERPPVSHECVYRRSIFMHVTPFVWMLTLVVLVAILAVDLFVVGRRPHEPSMREAAAWVAVY